MDIAQRIKCWHDSGIVLFVKEGKLAARSKPGAMTPDISKEIKSNKEAIIQCLSGLHAEKEQSWLASGEKDALASFAQQRFWLLHQITGGSQHHNMIFTLPLPANTKLPLLQETVDILLNRHEGLRTRFYSIENQLFQCIDDSVRPTIAINEVNDMTVQNAILEHHETQFDLSKAPLINIAVFISTGGSITLSVVMHHAIGDDWSTAILGREFLSIYQSLEKNTQPQLAELPYSYIDFSLWQHKTLYQNGIATEKLKADLAFWHAELSDAPREIPFPISKPSNTTSSYIGERQFLQLPNDQAARVRDYAKRKQVSMFELMLASLNTLMFKWASTNDVVIGTVEAGREKQEVNNIIGCFVNFLAIRGQLSKNDSLASQLEKVQRTFSNIRAHQSCPFDFIVDEIKPARGNKSPLYNVSLRYQNIQLLEDASHDDAILNELIPDTVNAQLDLMFSFIDVGDSTALCLDYDASMFDALLVKSLLNEYWDVVLAFVSDETTKVIDLTLSRSLAKHNEPVDYILANFSVEPMEPVLTFWNSQLSFMQPWRFAPFNQIQQQLLENSSSVYTESIENIAIIINWDSWLVGEHPLIFANEQSLQLLKILIEKEPLIRPCTIVFCPMSPEHEEMYGERISSIENEFFNSFSDSKVISVTPSFMVKSRYYTNNHFDINSFQSAHIPYTDEGYAAITTAMLRSIYRPKKSQFKVLVLDCDNTLWQGVVGEKGTKGINVSDTFKAFQTLVLSLKQKGVLLTLCSKNEENDVWDAIENNHDMMIKREDIAAAKINWHRKSDNIHSLAEELNLGLDSFIFIDDDLVQCAEVRANCPEVLVIQKPKIEDMHDWLNNIWVFDPILTANKASDRTHLYKQNKKRDLHKASTTTFAEYLSSLNTDVTFSPINENSLSRVSEISLRTNQFSTTLKRYDEETLLSLFTNKELFGFTVQVTDIFGDLGIVGAVLYSEKQDLASLEGFMLSCRSMGRGIEYEMMSHLGNVLVVENCEIPTVIGERNTPARNFIKEISSISNPLVMSTSALSNVRFNPEKATQTNERKINKRQDINASTVQGIPLTAWSSTSNYFTAEAIANASKTSQFPTKSSTIYVAPVTDNQLLLCNEIASLLGRSAVGTKDNFFALGGNSIQAVRLQSILTRAGKQLPLPLLFSEHSIEHLASKLDVCTLNASAKSIENHHPYPISFNDHWLLERPQPNHWNVSELFKLKPEFDSVLAKEAVRYILKHHSGLRRVWRKNDGKWNQLYLPLESLSDWWVEFHLDEKSDTDKSAEVERICAELQTQLDIGERLFYIAFFSFGKGQPGRLFMVFHHLIVDGYSLGILKEDLSLAYQQLQSGETVEVPETHVQLNDFFKHQFESAKQSSIHDINEWLDKCWENCADIYQNPLLSNWPIADTLTEPQFVKRPIDNKIKVLLDTCNDISNFDTETLFIGALESAFKSWYHGKNAFLCITRNNRAHKDFNLSRTIGWVSRYDFVYLDQPNNHSTQQYLESIKLRLKEAPTSSQSLQYLRFKSPDQGTKISHIPRHNLEFNYVPDAPDAAEMQENSAPEYKGREEGMHPIRFAPFGKLNTDNNQLNLTWGYSPAMYSETEMDDFLDLQIEHLEHLTKCLITEINNPV
ncbi:HAD-IIIC family phosphatase [Enterovibrio sp. FF113]|uniref:HAD-IIIC family phosphatase n=1 Tax=Enterovibrio sp. FF113 TaxID=3230010 RepID=UPI00352E4876